MSGDLRAIVTDDAVPVNIAEIWRIATAYPPEAAQTPLEERQRFFTSNQRAAWELRFGQSASGKPRNG